MLLREFDSNIWKICLIRMINSFTLIIPVIVLFFQENGLSMQDIFVLQVIFSVVVVFFEVPSGYFSDKFGRKIAIIFGAIVISIGHLSYAALSSFWGFAVGEIFFGIGYGFISGSDEALIYDSLLERGQESNHQKLEGLRVGIGLFSEGVASIIGGLLALISLRFPVYVEAGIVILSIPLAFSLREPKIVTVQLEDADTKGIYEILNDFLYGNSQVRNVSIYFSVVSLSTLLMFWMLQKYLEAISFPLGLFGVIFAALMFTASFFSWKSSKINSWLDEKKFMLVLWIMPIAGFALLALTFQSWSWIILFIFYFTRGLLGPFVSSYINKRVSSTERATILSVRNLLSRGLFCLAGPLVGWVCDAISLKAALIFSSVSSLLLGISFIFLFKDLKWIKKCASLNLLKI